MGERETHWDDVYETKGDRTSWFRPRLDRSLEIIDGLALPQHPVAIDVGAGTSTLVDDLLARGFSSVTINDLSRVALARTRARLGESADAVQCKVGDITTLELPEAGFDLWHDRAVFHFLTQPERRGAYVTQLERALRPGGYAVIATFGPNGPERCSDLPVIRYDRDSLDAVLGERFELLGHRRENHKTPWGAEQDFIYAWWRLDALSR